MVSKTVKAQFTQALSRIVFKSGEKIYCANEPEIVKDVLQKKNIISKFRVCDSKQVRIWYYRELKLDDIKDREAVQRW